MGQILAISEHYDLKGWGAESAKSWQVIADASRLAFADRGKYMADQDYVPMPTAGLLDADYLKERASLIEVGKALPEASPGNPPWSHAMNLSMEWLPLYLCCVTEHLAPPIMRY